MIAPRRVWYRAVFDYKCECARACHFIAHSCSVIITSDTVEKKKKNFIMPRQNQPRSQFVDAINQLPQSWMRAHQARMVPEAPAYTHRRAFFSFFFSIYVISNFHLLFHERCNTLMRSRSLARSLARAPTISLSKKVEVGVDRLGAREAPRPPSRLCSKPFAFCTLPPKP